MCKFRSDMDQIRGLTTCRNVTVTENGSARVSSSAVSGGSGGGGNRSSSELSQSPPHGDDKLICADTGAIVGGVVGGVLGGLLLLGLLGFLLWRNRKKKEVALDEKAVRAVALPVPRHADDPSSTPETVTPRLTRWICSRRLFPMLVPAAGAEQATAPTLLTSSPSHTAGTRAPTLHMTRTPTLRCTCPMRRSTPARVLVLAQAVVTPTATLVARREDTALRPHTLLPPVVWLAWAQAAQPPPTTVREVVTRTTEARPATAHRHTRRRTVTPSRPRAALRLSRVASALLVPLVPPELPCRQLLPPSSARPPLSESATACG